MTRLNTPLRPLAPRAALRGAWRVALVALVLACSRGGAEGPTPAVAQDPAVTRPLGLSPLAGQSIPVLPLTLVAPAPEVAQDTVYAGWRERATALRQADSLIGAALVERGPEVTWILPDELRKIARRSPGMVQDPDHLGHAMMRNPRLERMPDNLRSNMRGLVAVAGNRYVLIPAALGFSRTADGAVQADLSLVLADVRNGVVLWRSAAVGQGGTPAAALGTAMAALLPLTDGAP